MHYSNIINLNLFNETMIHRFNAETYTGVYCVLKSPDTDPQEVPINYNTFSILQLYTVCMEGFFFVQVFFENGLRFGIPQ